MTIKKVKLFGAFRELDASGEISITVGDKATIRDVQDAIYAEVLSRHLPYLDADLVFDSVLASESRVLNAEDIVGTGPETIAILPPVCGG